MRQKTSITIYLISIFIFTSCREDIIAPGNVAGNVNEPIQENELNHYTFLINADKLSANFSSKTNFNYSTTRILLTTSDTEGGSVSVGVRDNAGASLFSSTILMDVQNQYRKISGAIPDRINISLANFTGKLKVSLSYVRD